MTLCACGRAARKTSVWLCAADGTVRLPLRESDEDEGAGSGTGALRGGARDASATEAAAGLRVVASPRGDAVGICDAAGNELYSFRHLKVRRFAAGIPALSRSRRNCLLDSCCEGGNSIPTQLPGEV